MGFLIVGELLTITLTVYLHGSLVMTVDNSAEVRQQRVREFMQMLPLTIELAGLPLCEAGRMFTQDQLDLRGTHIRNAYKLARQIVKDVSEG